MMPKPPRGARVAGSSQGSSDSADSCVAARQVCYALGPPPPTGREPNVTRPLLDESRVHPAIRARLDGEGREVIAEVEAAIAANRIVVVGMAMNPFPRKARKLLDAAGVAYKYLEYGSYLSAWRKRLPLKLWTGWTTFPMIFVDGQFIGGANELERLGVETLKKGAA